MAIYKRAGELTQSDHQFFDEHHGPGMPVPFSGIYRCTGCGAEIAANRGDPFPPQNHHQHALLLPPVQWRLAVMSEGKA